MADIVVSVLQKVSQEAKQFKSTDVKKDIELEFDVGTLLATDINPIDFKRLRTETDDYLKSLARDNAQLLINKIWELPHERVDDVITAKLPQPTTVLPREKPIPKPKPPTKWEQYAKLKGIQKKKKEKLVWDKTVKDWRPRWGYRRVNDIKKDWLIEVPDNADPNVDYFGKKTEEKKERISKNEFQRLRNIARSQKIKVPKQGLPPTNNPGKAEVAMSLSLAKASTASAGKFTSTLPKEKPLKNTGKKRKFEPNISDMKKEKERNLQILEDLSKKKPKLDTAKAVNAHINKEETEQAQRNMKSGGKKKARKAGSKGRKNFFAQKGKRNKKVKK